MIFRWTQLVILVAVLAIPSVSQNAPAASGSKGQKPGTANASRISQPSTDNDGANAAVQSNEQDARSNAVQQNDDRDSGVPAPSVSEQAEAKLARETSSDHDSWSSTTALVLGLLAFSALVILAVILWRSGRRFARMYQSEIGMVDDFRRAA